MAIWRYLRVSPGDLRPLDATTMEAFLRGETPLPADERRFVHYVSVQIGEQGGVALGLERLWFARCEVQADGRLDQEAMLRRTNERLEVTRRLLADETGPPGLVVVDARDRFRARQLQHESRWEPEEADLDTLRRLVNERAGWALL